MICGELKFIGSGTQKAEDIISSEFKTLNVFRLDQDSARKKSTVPEMMKKMNSSQIDILLGTQMISKGFDFPDLSFAGVINADIGLGVPDFRSSERVYSLLTQLAGRCGRRGDRGKVIIQTRDPMNPIFSFLRNNDYVGFMEREISIRKALAYPPFSFLMRLIIKDPDERKAAERSFEIEAFLDANIPQDVDVLGPAPAPIEKIGKNYRYHFILKSRTRSSLLLTASKLRQVKNLKADIDIDPSDMM